ncbi:thioesterase family protein [Bacteroidales bacterium]
MFISELTFEVRYYETDMMGIVHHSNYIRYFEIARTKALKDLGLPIEKIESSGIMMPVIHVECDYKIPVKMGEEIRIISRIKELPRVKFTIDSDIFNEKGEKVACGSVTLGFIHSGNRRPTRVPEFVLDVFSPYFKNY